MQRRYQRLQEFRQVISFLQLIPDEIYFQFDTRDFFLPIGEVGVIREVLEKKLGQYVMTYTVASWHMTEPKKHLCAYLVGAKLDYCAN